MLDLADQIVIGYARKGGMLERQLTDNIEKLVLNLGSE